MGLGWLGLGTRYSTPPSHPAIPHPGYTPAHPGVPGPARPGFAGPGTLSQEAVGLKSVDQLSLSVLFSGFRGITEGYNLLRIGRITNHLYIPGTK